MLKGGVLLSRPKKEIRDFRSEIITAPEAALLLGLHERSFYRLVEEGNIPKMSDGKYILGDVSEAYWKFCLGSEGLEAEQTRLTKAKADMAELELAELRGEMHRATAVMRVWADNVLNAKTRLLSIPSKIAPEFVGKTLQEITKTLKDSINEALQELSEYDERRITRAATSFRK